MAITIFPKAWDVFAFKQALPRCSVFDFRLCQNRFGRFDCVLSQFQDGGLKLEAQLFEVLLDLPGGFAFCLQFLCL